jgi:transcriptional regulator with XRE-family HTH domain
MNGAQFAAKRRSLYLTQEELANLLKVDVGAVERWEAPHEEVPLEIQQGLVMLEFKLEEDYENGPPEYRQLVDRRHRDWDREELLRRRAEKKRRIE